MTERITLLGRLRRRLGLPYTTLDSRYVMPVKFEPLAVFNAEVARGIAHTPETIMRMAELQAEFNDWIYTRQEG